MDSTYKDTFAHQESIPVVKTENWINGLDEKTPSPIEDLESRTSTPTECLSEPIMVTGQKLTSTNVDYTVN